MLDSPTSVTDTQTFVEHSNQDDVYVNYLLAMTRKIQLLFIWHRTLAAAGREDILCSSNTPSHSFAGAANIDTHYSTFNDVAGNQYITYVNHTSHSEKVLATLKPVDRGGYYVSQCMKGTWEDVFRNIDHWLDDVDAPNVLWLSGSPGAGKLTIVSSLVPAFSSNEETSR